MACTMSVRTVVNLHSYFRKGNCTRTVEETADVVTKNWSDLNKRLKPILKKVKEERQKEAEQNVYLD